VDESLVVVGTEIEGLQVALLRLFGPPCGFVDQPQQEVHVGMGALLLEISPAEGRGLIEEAPVGQGERLGMQSRSAESGSA
jgi:hypothetical protein